MTSFDKLYRKYAASGPILPPPPDEEVKVEVPVESDEIPREWSMLEDFDPLTEKPAQSPEELLEIVRDVPKQDVPVEDIGGDMPTVPPPRKRANLSPDVLLKLCSHYQDLAHKF